eukprot:1143655-Pelagomonas_calceolata.AAC.8
MQPDRLTETSSIFFYSKAAQGCTRARTHVRIHTHTCTFTLTTEKVEACVPRPVHCLHSSGIVVSTPCALQAEKTSAEIHGAMLQCGVMPHDHIGTIGINCPEYMLSIQVSP